jgi:predicted transcriptional regulator YdeE
MNPTFEEKDEMKLAGIYVRTSNRLESDAKTARIPALWQRFYQENVAGKIPGLVNPQVIYEAYSDYESDQDGEYTVILGGEVESIENLPEGMLAIIVPRARYIVTPATGEDVPAAVQQAWRQVWKHFESPKPYRRAYQVDFEQFRIGASGNFDECRVMVSVR